MPLIDIREHGGVFGGISSLEKFVDVYNGLTPPQNPKIYDIWIKTTEDISSILFNDIEPALSEGQVFILLVNKEYILKGGNYTKAGKNIYIREDATPQFKKRVFQSKFLDIYANYSITKKLKGGIIVFLEAYYYDGTQWVMFSNANPRIYLSVFNSGTNERRVLAYNSLTDSYVNSVITGNSNNNQAEQYAIDKVRRCIYAQRPYQSGVYGFQKLDYDFNLLGYIGTSGTLIDSRSQPFYANNGILFFMDWSTANLIMYNVDTNSAIRTIIGNSSYTQITSFEDIDETTGRLAFVAKPSGTSSWNTILYDYVNGVILNQVDVTRGVKLLPNSNEGFASQGANNKIYRFKDNNLASYIYQILVYQDSYATQEFVLTDSYQNLVYQDYKSGTGSTHMIKVDVATGSNVHFDADLKPLLNNYGFNRIDVDALGNILGSRGGKIYKHSKDGIYISTVDPSTLLAGVTLLNGTKMDYA